MIYRTVETCRNCFCEDFLLVEMSVRSKVQLLVLFLTLEEYKKILCYCGTLPPLKRSAWNHLMMLGSYEEFMVFWGSRSQRSKCFYILFYSVSRWPRKCSRIELTLHWNNSETIIKNLGEVSDMCTKLELFGTRWKLVSAISLLRRFVKNENACSPLLGATSSHLGALVPQMSLYTLDTYE